MNKELSSHIVTLPGAGHQWERDGWRGGAPAGQGPPDQHQVRDYDRQWYIIYIYIIWYSYIYNIWYNGMIVIINIRLRTVLLDRNGISLQVLISKPLIWISISTGPGKSSPCTHRATRTSPTRSSATGACATSPSPPTIFSLLWKPVPRESMQSLGGCRYSEKYSFVFVNCICHCLRHSLCLCLCHRHICCKFSK